MGFSTINYPFGGTPITMETPISGGSNLGDPETVQKNKSIAGVAGGWFPFFCCLGFGPKKMPFWLDQKIGKDWDMVETNGLNVFERKSFWRLFFVFRISAPNLCVVCHGQFQTERPLAFANVGIVTEGFQHSFPMFPMLAGLNITWNSGPRVASSKLRKPATWNTGLFGTSWTSPTYQKGTVFLVNVARWGEALGIASNMQFGSFFHTLLLLSFRPKNGTISSAVFFATLGHVALWFNNDVGMTSERGRMFGKRMFSRDQRSTNRSGGFLKWGYPKSWMI